MTVKDALDPRLLTYYHEKFQLRCYTVYGDAFEDFFEGIIQKSNPSFVSVSSGGGDLGSDGLELHGDTVYAVYCPQRTTHISCRRLINKMTDDFQKFLDNWSEKRKWIFVYGRFEYPPQAVKLAEELQAEHGKEIELWNANDLWKEIERLSISDLYELFGPPPIRAEDIDVVQSTAVQPSYQPPVYYEWSEGDLMLSGTRWQIHDTGMGRSEFLDELADRIRSRFGDPCEVRKFALTDVLYRSPVRKLSALPHLRVLRTRVQVRTQVSPIVGDEGFQFWIAIMDNISEHPVLNSLIHRLREGQSHSLEPSLGVRGGVFLARLRPRPSFYFKVTCNDTVHELIGERNAFLEESHLADGMCHVKLVIQVPPVENMPERILQIVGASVLDMNTYSQNLICLDVGYEWESLEIGFWIPRYPDPSECIRACEDCELRDKECFDTHYWPKTSCKDAMMADEYADLQAFLDSDEFAEFCRIYEKGLADTYVDQRSEEEKEVAEKLWTKARMGRERVDQISENLDGYCRMPRPLPPELQLEVLRIVRELRPILERGAVASISSLEHPGTAITLTPNALDEIRAVLID